MSNDQESRKPERLLSIWDNLLAWLITTFLEYGTLVNAFKGIKDLMSKSITSTKVSPLLFPPWYFWHPLAIGVLLLLVAQIIMILILLYKTLSWKSCASTPGRICCGLFCLIAIVLGITLLTMGYSQLHKSGIKPSIHVHIWLLIGLTFFFLVFMFPRFSSLVIRISSKLSIVFRLPASALKKFWSNVPAAMRALRREG